MWTTKAGVLITFIFIPHILREKTCGKLLPPIKYITKDNNYIQAESSCGLLLY